MDAYKHQSRSDDNAPSEHMRLAAILDQMPVGIGIFDQQGHLYHANQHFETAAGGAISSIHAMSGAFWRGYAADGSLLDEQFYPGLQALKGQVATPGVDFVRTSHDGQERWIGVSAVPLTAPGSPGVVGAVVVIEDVAHRRHAMEQQRASEARFRRFAEYSSNALWIAAVETGKIAYLSPAAQRIWSDCRSITTLAEWLETVHPDDRVHASESRRRVAMGDVQCFSYRLVGDSGAISHHLRETSFPIPGIDGEDACIGGIVEDVSPEIQVYLVQRAGVEDIQLMNELRGCARRIKTFKNEADLLDVAEVLNPGCVLVDLRGLALPAQALADLLRNRPPDLQLIVIGSRNTSASEVIRAMRAGAIDFLLEPIPAGAIAQSVYAACAALPARAADAMDDCNNIGLRLAALPRREREVLLGLVTGGTNKSIARTLGISPRTVEVHRAHLMERLNVRSLSDLLHLAHTAGLPRPS
ncbi:hypothetical protein BH10PSE12_BH10PSE12_28130 [soil metagenome]